MRRICMSCTTACVGGKGIGIGTGTGTGIATGIGFDIASEVGYGARLIAYGFWLWLMA